MKNTLKIITYLLTAIVMSIPMTIFLSYFLMGCSKFKWLYMIYTDIPAEMLWVFVLLALICTVVVILSQMIKLTNVLTELRTKDILKAFQEYLREEKQKEEMK